MELHNTQPCNMTLYPAVLVLMSVSLSRGIITEMVTADSTHITSVVNHRLLFLSHSGRVTYSVK